MIKDRPAQLLARPEYRRLPTAPLRIDFAAVPELVNASLIDLGGIQPITGAMSAAAGGPLFDRPSEGEIELHRRLGTKFQLVSVVVSTASFELDQGTAIGVPYSISLMPASKRGSVQEVGIESVAALDIERHLSEAKPCYLGYDPFTGDWSLFGQADFLLAQRDHARFADEVGLVVAQYFLATTYDPADVLSLSPGFLNPATTARYNRHRQKLLYSRFQRVEARRVWGAQSPIELFLLQELLRRGIRPRQQVLLFEDGSTHPSLYDLWRDLEFRHTPGLITEADFFFSEDRVAVFCDSTRHHRGKKAKNKDRAIDERLHAIGISSIRVPGSLIVSEVETAASRVVSQLPRL